MNKNRKIVDKYEELVKAVFDRIGTEYERYYWNKYQKETYSPFYGGGGEYINDVFYMHSYNWDYDGNTADVNFDYKDGEFCATWYKHSHRGLYFWSRRGKKIDAEFLNKMLKDCLESLKWDFEDKKDQYR